MLLKNEDRQMQKLNEIRPVYWARGYNLSVPLAQIMSYVYECLQILRPGSWVLDLGGGEGRFLKSAPPDRPYLVYAVEVIAAAFKKYAALMKRQGRGDVAVQGDVTDPKVYRVGVAAAIMWRVLHALPPELHRKVCELVFNSLLPGGSFFIAVLSEEDWECKALPEYQRGVMHDLALVRGLKEPFPAFFFWEEYFLELLKNAGFEIVKIQAFMEGTGFLKNKQEGKPPHSFFFAHVRKPAQ